MRKKRLTEIINFRVTLVMKERLEAEARLLGIDMSDVIRMKLSQSTVEFKVVALPTVDLDAADISEGRLTANGNTEEVEDIKSPGIIIYTQRVQQ